MLKGICVKSMIRNARCSRAEEGFDQQQLAVDARDSLYYTSVGESADMLLDAFQGRLACQVCEPTGMRLSFLLILSDEESQLVGTRATVRAC